LSRPSMSDWQQTKSSEFRVSGETEGGSAGGAPARGITGRCDELSRGGSLRASPFFLIQSTPCLKKPRGLGLNPKHKSKMSKNIRIIRNLCQNNQKISLSLKQKLTTATCYSWIASISVPTAGELARFFAQVALTVMLRNGDGHLKNFAVLYDDNLNLRLSPVYDVVTTAIYRYARFSGGPELEDRTLALRLFRKSRSKTWPGPAELLRFGRVVCGVSRPDEVLLNLAQAMSETLVRARGDQRIPRSTLEACAAVWDESLMAYSGN